MRLFQEGKLEVYKNIGAFKFESKPKEYQITAETDVNIYGDFDAETDLIIYNFLSKNKKSNIHFIKVEKSYVKLMNPTPIL